MIGVSPVPGFRDGQGSIVIAIDHDHRHRAQANQESDAGALVLDEQFFGLAARKSLPPTGKPTDNAIDRLPVILWSWHHGQT